MIALDEARHLVMEASLPAGVADALVAMIEAAAAENALLTTRLNDAQRGIVSLSGRLDALDAWRERLVENLNAIDARQRFE